MGEERMRSNGREEGDGRAFLSGTGRNPEEVVKCWERKVGTLDIDRKGFY